MSAVDTSVDTFGRRAEDLVSVLRRVLLGQEDVITQTVTALLAGGHVLLEGVPGLGKTRLVRAMADALELSYSRIQFTPDLMPADITGTMILREDDSGRRVFTFRQGPIFGNVVLADEINRATPKTQSALLEGMQEGTVTAGGETRALPAPFFVLATQNPLEMEGTYPLPEAQLDRFLLKVLVPYPPRDVLRDIGRQPTDDFPSISPVLNGHEIDAMVAVGRQVPIATPVLDYAIALVLATRPETTHAAEVRRYVRAGASPRGLQALVNTSRVRALLDGRYNVSVEDIRALAHPALRHRLILSFEGQAEGMSADALLDTLLSTVPAP
jgi:MoxR-like ATPase